MQYWLVMPAAGSGQRFGSSLVKQYAPLAGHSVIAWSLQPFIADPRCRGIVVALSPGDTGFAQLALATADQRLRSCIGGARRCDSVLAALKALPAGDHDWVLVHDAVRPCVEAAEIDRLLSRAADHAVGGLLALALSDTLKSDDGSGTVVATVPRQRLWRALTPQMFRFGALRDALEDAIGRGVSPTDEAQALELRGEHPLLVEGSPQNLKVTTAADLVLAELVLRMRRASL